MYERSIHKYNENIEQLLCLWPLSLCGLSCIIYIADSENYSTKQRNILFCDLDKDKKPRTHLISNNMLFLLQYYKSYMQYK